ncbi:MFS transporter [Sanguibacter sp. Z1732]|uniref:MFS transporter n=1 Tax=Sanguibacter sp. Z1732 TaxID=3435412 RepID=UPI003D9C94D3
MFAPISGQRADRTGRRTLWLGLNTTLVVIASAGLFFVAPAPEYLWLGLLLLAAGNVAFEFASVNYYAMLNDLSTPKNIGRVSGLGWGLGYIGGIVLLLIIFFGFIDPEVGLFGVTSENGMDVRISMLLAAAWFGVFMLPVLWVMRRTAGEPRPPKERFAVIDSYRGCSARSPTCGRPTATRCSSSSPRRCSGTAWPGCSPSVAWSLPRCSASRRGT